MARESFTRLSTLLADLEIAWQDRLADAQTLLAAGRHAAAISNGLYALEIRLKVRICKRLDLLALPKMFEIHDLPSLLLLAGLSRRIEGRKAKLVRLNWDDMLFYGERLNDLRYKPDQNWSQAQATTFFSQLLDPPDGILPWLTKQ